MKRDHNTRWAIAGAIGLPILRTVITIIMDDYYGWSYQGTWLQRLGLDFLTALVSFAVTATVAMAYIKYFGKQDSQGRLWLPPGLPNYILVIGMTLLIVAVFLKSYVSGYPLVVSAMVMANELFHSIEIVCSAYLGMKVGEWEAILLWQWAHRNDPKQLDD